ncbi:MAG: bifunctional riboflavin kinase/FAD synthetase [bacterium]|nr:bifunctional riboflavin kinase/FAD synthetase [bacterium]
MQLFTDLESVGAVTAGGVCLSIGVFDGVHRGHQLLIRNTRRRARQLGQRAMVLTFTAHPLSVLAPPYAPQLLTSPEEKARLLEHYGADLCLMLEFTPRFAATEARDFVERVIAGVCHAHYIACGRDFRFGAGGAGDVNLLQAMGPALGFEVEVCESLVDGGSAIKSTRVRQSLYDGNLAETRLLLGRNYALRGTIVRGDGRGRQLGYPTANLAPPAGRLVPGDGVYAVRLRLSGGEWGGMMNIGVRPTFGAERRTQEVHLFDFTGDLYGREVEVEFIARIRKERRFESLQALIAQLRADERACREILKNE